MSARHPPPHGYILTTELAQARGVKPKTITKEVRLYGKYLGFTPIATSARCFAWPVEILQVPKRVSAPIPSGFVSSKDLAQALGVKHNTPASCFSRVGSFRGYEPLLLGDGSFAWPVAILETVKKHCYRRGAA